MNTGFRVFASYNILQYTCMWDFIHVLIFVTVSKCRKSPKSKNVAIPVKVLGDDCMGFTLLNFNLFFAHFLSRLDSVVDPLVV